MPYKNRRIRAGELRDHALAKGKSHDVQVRFHHSELIRSDWFHTGFFNGRARTKLYSSFGIYFPTIAIVKLYFIISMRYINAVRATQYKRYWIFKFTDDLCKFTKEVFHLLGESCSFSLKKIV